MTINDFIRERGLQEYEVSAGDNIKTIMSTLYRDYSYKFWEYLIAVNDPCLDWDAYDEKTGKGLKPGTIIKYIPYNYVLRINEVVGI